MTEKKKKKKKHELEADLIPVWTRYFKARESQQCEHTGGHPAGQAKLSCRCSFFRGILPAKVWKLLSHIHMVNRFRDSFLRKTFLFLTVSDAGWRGSGSHTSMTEHVTHTVTHTLTFAFILLALPSLSLLFCVSLSALPFHNLPGREVRKKGEREKKTKQWSLPPVPLLLSPSCCWSSFSPPCLPASSLPPSSQWDVLTLCNRCVCCIQSAKPIDPLTTSFREEQVCTCAIYLNTGVHEYWHRKTLVYTVIWAQCWQK